MRRLVFTFLAVFFLACGASDTAENGGDEGGMAAGAPAGGEGAGTGSARRLDTDSQSIMARTCLSMVRNGHLGYAHKACVAALEADPDNTELQEAVAKTGAAQAGAAEGVAAAEAAAGAMAAEAAAGIDAAKDEADDAAGGMDEVME